MYNIQQLGKPEQITQLQQPSWLFTSGSEKKRINLIALGDVGQTVAMALKLLGSDCLSTIGVYDINQNAAIRLELELNQIHEPFSYNAFPNVQVISEDQLFNCEILAFCASKGIPPLDSNVADVRMIQYEANKSIISLYAKMAVQQHFQGLFAVISDPVDPLCKAAFRAASGKLHPNQIQGYGLGVMNARAAYYAKKDPKFASFLQEGRAFGPHGQDLIIANSIEHYDEALSLELTQLTVDANLEVRKCGYKPYLAPAISSAALSLLRTIKGEWHYSSNYLNSVYFGSLNQTKHDGLEWEVLDLPQPLFQRLQTAYQNLEAIK